MFHSDQSPPYGLLIFGFFLFILGVVGTCTGEAWGRFGSVTYRAKEPKQFWWLVASHYACGIFLIVYFLYKVN